MKNYLFVCRHNFTRSKFITEFFRGFLEGKKIEARVYSAGIGFVSSFFGKRVNKRFLKKMSLIFVMEGYMKEQLIQKFELDKQKIIVLRIKDEYGFLKKKNIDDLDKIFERIKWEKWLK